MLRNPVLKALLLFILSISLLEASLRLTGYFYLRKLYADLSGIKNKNNSINIICLGESSTGGLWVDWKDSYPKQLELDLRKFYRNQNIQVIIPPHVGQNTSQIANRIKGYIDMYKPRCVILMVGANNEWSLAESHILRFIPDNDAQALKVKALVVMSDFRVFKLVHYLYLRFFAKERSEYTVANRFIVWGHPENCRFPPQKWIYSFAERNRKAFLELWAHDVREIIRESKRSQAQVLLMTYHMNPAYLSVENFLEMARQEQVLLVRNDVSFHLLSEQGTLSNYLLHDGWHPNKDGYAIIAGNAFEAIRHNNLLNLKGGSE